MLSANPMCSPWLCRAVCETMHYFTCQQAWIPLGSRMLMIRIGSKFITPLKLVIVFIITTSSNDLVFFVNPVGELMVFTTLYIRSTLFGSFRFMLSWRNFIFQSPFKIKILYLQLNFGLNNSNLFRKCQNFPLAIIGDKPKIYTVLFHFLLTIWHFWFYSTIIRDQFKMSLRIQDHYTLIDFKS
jgi:hypothetical protein